jgi:hypothetical protein
MVRCRYQDGYLFTRGKKRKMWVARWRDGVIQPDGTVERILRSEVLGLVSEIPSRREARILSQSRLASGSGHDVNRSMQHPAQAQTR